jgi:tRNA uridine 5-carboxymethylaminomethyl modification enzyme
MDLGREAGLLDAETHAAFERRRGQIHSELGRLEKVLVKADDEINATLRELESSEIAQATTLSAFLRRPEISYLDLDRLVHGGADLGLPPEVREQVEIQVKYDGYIKRQLSQVEQHKKIEEKGLPETLDFSQIYGLSREAREKLLKHKPHSVGQASRISGVTPADISVLLVYLEALRHSGALTVPEPNEMFHVEP